MVQSYAGEAFQAFGLELWNGSQGLAEAFVTTTGMTYPLLMNAGTTSIKANYTNWQDVAFVIDGNQIIRHHGSGFNETQVRAAIDEGLAQLTTGVETPAPPEPFLLHPARPNPFNPSTTIAWTIDADIVDARVRVEILDVRGRKLATLVDGTLPGGREHRTVWDGRADGGARMVSGTYIVRLDVDGRQQSRFLTLVK